MLDGELTTKAIGDFEPLGIIFRHLRAPAKGSSRSARSDRHLPRGPVRQPEDRAGRCIPRDILPTGSANRLRSEEHTSELQSLMRISYAVFCLKKQKNT